MPKATKANVKINSIHVLDSSVNTTSEPGDAAEWFMTFIVNGQAALWSNENVKDDTIYAVNREFPFVDLGPNQMISIQVSGYEDDSTSANDTLPTLSLTLTPAMDFDLGGTRWSGMAQSGEGSYNIEYTVMPAAYPSPKDAQPRQYVGAYRTGGGGHALWVSDWKGFTKKWEELSKQGLRLTRLSTFRQDTGVLSFGDSTERRYVGVFRAGADAHALWVSEWPEFQAKWQELTKGGLRLVDIAPFTDDGKLKVAGVFRAGTDAHALWVSEWDAFDQKWKELTKGGLRLVALDTFKEGGKRKFVGAFRAGAGAHALVVGLEWDAFLAKRKELAAAGLRLEDIASYAEGNKQLFAGVFGAGTDLQALKRGTWSEFEFDWQQAGKKDLRLVSVDSFAVGQEE